MKPGKLIQNGVHLEDHEWVTVKFFREELGKDIELIPKSKMKEEKALKVYVREFKCTKGARRLKIVKKNREVLDFKK